MANGFEAMTAPRLANVQLCKALKCTCSSYTRVGVPFPLSSRNRKHLIARRSFALFPVFGHKLPLSQRHLRADTGACSGHEQVQPLVSE